MKYKALRKAVDGIFAYDYGSVDSGIKDEALRAKVIDHISGLDATSRHELLARLTIDLWLAPEALAEGYTVEDAREFISWLDDRGLVV